MFRWLIASLGLPLVWALGKTLLQGWLVVFGDQQGGWGSPLALFLYGLGAMVLACVFLHPILSVTYVFAHEMTHLLVGLLFFARPKHIEIHRDEGFVELTHTNCIILLAPYCIPFYLLLTLLIQLLLSYMFPGCVSQTTWVIIYGAMMGYHFIYTFASLMTVGQSDVREYGRLFSYWLILIVNLSLATLPLLVLSASAWTWSMQWKTLRTETIETYQWVGQKLQTQTERWFAPRGE